MYVGRVDRLFCAMLPEQWSQKNSENAFKFLYTFNFTWFFITSINLIFNAKVRLDPKTYSEIMSVTEFICDIIKNLAPLCDATDEHRVVMAFPVVVIYQKGSDDITICGKGNYKSLILRLKSFYGFYNKNFYTSQRKNLNQVCHLNSWCHLNLLSPSLTTYIHHAIARLSNEMTQIVNAPKTIKRTLLHLKIQQFPQKYGLSVLYPIQRFWK